MIQRVIVAISIAVLTAFALSGVSEAAKGPDAAEVGLGTLLAALGLLVVLSLLYGLKLAFGGAGRLPPPEEPSASDHH